MIELRRLLLSPKRLLMLMMIAAVNLALFSGYCRAQREEQIAYYEMMRMSGSNVQGQERLKYQQYLEKDYYDYLSYVQQQSDAQSILSSLSHNGESDFVTRNHKKTTKDYGNLGNVKLRSGENRGILAAADYKVTDLLLMIAPLLLILELNAETDSAVSALTRTTKRGRVPLCAWQTLAVFLLSAASVLCLYGGNLLYTAAYYGAPDLTRAIQSLPEYKLCSLRISVGGYFLASGLLKAAALTVIALTVRLLLARFHAVIGWAISAGIFGSAFLLYRLILPTAKINHLKFLNIFAVLDADIFFRQYCNLNWFGYPSGFRTDMLLLVSSFLLLLTLFSLLLVGYCRPMKSGRNAEILKERFARFFTMHQPCHSLFGFEGWKLLIGQRAVFVLLAAGLMGVSLYQDIHLYAPANPDTQGFYSRFGGEVTLEKIRKAAAITVGEKDTIKKDQIALAHAYLNHEPELRVSKIKQRIADEQAELKRYEALLTAMVDLSAYTHKTGRPAWLIDQSAYQLMFRENAAERRCCMVLLLYLIFMFAGIRAYDNRYDTRMLLRSTKRGRAGIFTAQTIWCMLLTAAAVTGLHGIYLIRLIQDVGFYMPEAPAQSLAMFRALPFSVSLRTCIVLFFVLRFLIAVLITAGITVISRFSKTPQKALLLALAVFLLPSALAESGISQFAPLDFVHKLSCCIR